MTGITQMLHPQNILLELHGRRKNEVLHELVQILFQTGRISDPAAVEEGLMARERLASTGIGFGIAIPHLLTEAVSETVMAFGRKREGIHFDAADGRPVTLVFLIVGPKHQEYNHLLLLSRLSRLLHHAELRSKLLEAPSAEALIGILDEEERKEG